MDILSADFWVALGTIVFIDLILAGDNAIVIGLAAKNLPHEQRTKAVIWGTLGAVAIRVIATIFVLHLLKIPFIQLVAGLLLIWIAFKLLVSDDDHGNIKAGNSLMAAIRTIIIADAAMGIDNVIAVAGAAHGDTILVIIGLMISVPIVVWCSTLFIKLTDRFPVIIYLGSGVLAYTASKMMTHDKKLTGFFEDNPAVKWMLMALVIIGVLIAGKFVNDRKASQKNEAVNTP
ncbi:TerC family protein [Marinicrinis lubricantis]|uniref:TerC family protein n=1 Tax=Marinicrinis lubricantis TaxID=2086470 RepID=A0ABW1IV04_9BACL